MKRRSAFTLVELLVVIGIIAVLISILLPSLARARNSAQLVQCGALLRQIGVAARAYAAENRDALPPMAMDNGSRTFEAYTNSSGTRSADADPNQNVAWVRTQGPYFINAQTGAEITNPTIGASLGRLVTTKFLKGDFLKMISCPNALSSAGSGGGTVYSFNIHYAYRTPGPAGNYLLQPWWKRLSQYGKTKGTYTVVPGGGGNNIDNYNFRQAFALGMDPLLTPATGQFLGSATHLNKSGRAYNMLFPDGSVQVAVLPNTIQRPNGVNNYGRFLDFSGYLETIVDGRNAGGSNVQWGSNSNWYVTPLNP
jgi:prepilin-type N-terminal cleavage/methylation domain-containing protein